MAAPWPEHRLAETPANLRGCEKTASMGRKLASRRAEVQGRIAQAQIQIQQLQGQATYLNGALEDIDYWENIWGGSGTPADAA